MSFIVLVLGVCAVFDDVRAFGQSAQAELVVAGANAARDVTVFREGIAQLESGECVVCRFPVLRVVQEIAQEMVGFCAVKIVCVNDCEWGGNAVLCGQYGVGGAPGFLACMRICFKPP